MSRLTAVFLIIGCQAVTLSGCAQPQAYSPEVDHNQLSDFAFEAYLNESTLVTNDEAMRVMLILADGEDASKGFDERRAKLESRGIIHEAWELHPSDPANYGTVAYMTCRICDISGGVNMHLIGATGLGDRRYALRELIYRELTDEAVSYQYITGPALFALSRKAADIMEEKGLFEPSGIELSDETDRDAEGNLIVPDPLPQAPADEEPEADQG